MNKAHIWSDIPKDWRASSQHDAEKHAGNVVDLVVEVKNIRELKDQLKDWVEMDATFDVLDFHTHGGPGFIHIGAAMLNAFNLYQLYVPNIHHLFGNNAQVIFNGCNVAEGYQGEYFLLAFGKMMLKGGGTVIGSTGTGIADPILSGDVVHPLGEWVTAEVGTGGTAKLRGHKHLNPEKIKSRIENAEERIRKLNSPRFLSPMEVLKLKNWLNIARTYAALPTQENMFHACDHLRMVEMALAKKDWVPENAIK